jgi:putative FmdB family regulatory protein
MPTYDFECEPCAYYTEIVQPFDSASLLKCPVCEQKTLKKVILSPPSIFVRGESSTIGQMADRNYKKMGHYEKQERVQQDQAPDKMTKEQKEKRATHQKINSMTPEQKVKWIKNGD